MGLPVGEYRTYYFAVHFYQHKKSIGQDKKKISVKDATYLKGYITLVAGGVMTFVYNNFIIINTSYEK